MFLSYFTLRISNFTVQNAMPAITSTASFEVVRYADTTLRAMRLWSLSRSVVPFLLILLAHIGAPYKSNECTTFDSSLLFPCLTEHTFGNIFWRFCTAMLALSAASFEWALKFSSLSI